MSVRAFGFESRVSYNWVEDTMAMKRKIPPTEDCRSYALAWLDGESMHERRPDLAELLLPGAEVTLTYEQLFEVIQLVRYNSRQR